MHVLDFESLKERLLEDRTLWWGHSAEHGWIVLDNTDPRTESNPRRYIRFRDWTPIELHRADFGTDQCRWFVNFIGKLGTEDEKHRACSELHAFSTEFILKRDAFRITRQELEHQQREAERKARSEAAIVRHAERLSRVGIPNQGVRPRRDYRFRRVTVCWGCRKRLDNEIDIECRACGWIICPCGACDCTRN